MLDKLKYLTVIWLLFNIIVAFTHMFFRLPFLLRKYWCDSIYLGWKLMEKNYSGKSWWQRENWIILKFKCEVRGNFWEKIKLDFWREMSIRMFLKLTRHFMIFFSLKFSEEKFVFLLEELKYQTLYLFFWNRCSNNSSAENKTEVVFEVNFST